MKSVAAACFLGTSHRGQAHNGDRPGCKDFDKKIGKYLVRIYFFTIFVPLVTTNHDALVISHL